MDQFSDLSRFASELLSPKMEISDAAIVRVLDQARSGKQDGLEALEEAIYYMHGNKNVNFYSPGLRRLNGFQDLKEAKEKILFMASNELLWKTPPQEVQELLSIAQAGGMDLRSIWSTAKELGYAHDQIRAIQLLGLHLAVQVILSKV